MTLDNAGHDDAADPKPRPPWYPMLGWTGAICFCACMVLMVIGAAKAVLFG